MGAWEGGDLVLRKMFVSNIYETIIHTNLCSFGLEIMWNELECNEKETRLGK